MNCGSGGACRCRQKKQAFQPLPQLMGRPHDMPRVTQIMSIKQETPFVGTFTLNLSVGAKPGQFVMVWIPRVDEKPFSVAYDDGQQLQLTIAEVGPFTTELFKKQVGNSLGIRGPYGRCFDYKSDEHLAVVGGGYGAAPLYFLASEAVRRGCTIEFIVGARSSEHLLFVERARGLEGVTVHVSTDDGSQGHHGTNVQILEELLQSCMKLDRILTVGPERMMKAVSDVALDYAIPCQVSLERYMKCGFGICGQCVVDESGIATCMQGPVMDHLLAREQHEFGLYHRDKVGRKVQF